MNKTYCKHGHLRIPENVSSNGTCKTCSNIRATAWNRAHQEVAYARSRASILAHPETLKKWREENREAIREATRKAARNYRQTHKEKRCEDQRLRKTRKKGAHGSHTLEEFRALGDICLRCGSEGVTRDHVLPLIHGGNDNISNIQPLCVPCNSWKKDKFIDYR